MASEEQRGPRFLFIANGNGLCDTPSGGALRDLELIRYLIEHEDASVHPVGTSGCERMFEGHGLPLEFDRVCARLFFREERHRLHRLISYIVSTVHCSLKVLSLARRPFDFIYTGSDFFCDIIPARLLASLNPSAKWVTFIHHLYPHPRERRGSLLRNLFGYLAQRFSFALIRRKARLIMVYDTAEGEAVKTIFERNGFPPERFLMTQNGINLEAIQSVSPGPEKFDACFLGGLRPAKGMFELVPICQRLRREHPQARLLVMGHATPGDTRKLRVQVAEAGLDDAILLVGNKEGEEKYALLKSSRVFINPSHEEGWSIAILEALACGLPVVAYDLPAYRRTYGGLIRTVPLGDTNAFGGAAADYLREGAGGLPDAARELVERFTWDRILRRDAARILGTGNPKGRGSGFGEEALSGA